MTHPFIIEKLELKEDLLSEWMLIGCMVLCAENKDHICTDAMQALEIHLYSTRDCFISTPTLQSVNSDLKSPLSYFFIVS